MDGTNKIKIAGQPGVNLPAVFCVIGNYSVMFLLHKNAPRGCDQIRMSRSSGIFLIEGLLHECAIFTELTVSVFAAGIQKMKAVRKLFKFAYDCLSHVKISTVSGKKLFYNLCHKNPFFRFIRNLFSFKNQSNTEISKIQQKRGNNSLA